MRDGGRKERIGQVARCIYRAVRLEHMMTRKYSKHKQRERMWHQQCTQRRVVNCKRSCIHIT
ncbi:hypothetical protein K443DRAFT_630572 [Laccaria amethystina LaAM-08-1]|uniref:Uncharacterized protein n=1 Tax=Laccaria amethystina LaAM-08-1 TaxID=1095629 RepID=A0A0C9WY48_9AGAR|nr:hypothetical protein K443DRAFT_630572 [Laccaria amethystina LaAM-08-1]